MNNQYLRKTPFANPQQVDIFGGSFQFNSDLLVNAERLRVGVNQDENSPTLEMSSSSLVLTDALVGTPQGDFSSLRILSDATLEVTRLDVGVSGPAELILKESFVQANRLRVGYAPIDALDILGGDASATALNVDAPAFCPVSTMAPPPPRVLAPVPAATGPKDDPEP